jgi:hypothetical protein
MIDTGLCQADFDDSHAPVIKHNEMIAEKIIGARKKYCQLRIVTTTKQMASAHATPRIRAKAAGGSDPSCHATIAANTRNTDTNIPNPL